MISMKSQLYQVNDIAMGLIMAVSILLPRCQQQQAWQKQNKHKR